MEFKYYLNFIYELILLSMGITPSTGSTSIRNGWYITIYTLIVALAIKIDELPSDIKQEENTLLLKWPKA